MKLVLGLLSVCSLALANEAPLHTGELLYQVKKEYQETDDDSFIRVHRPRINSDIESIRQKMIDSGRFEFVEYNTIESTNIEDMAEANDPNFDRQWQHEKIETELAWSSTTGSNNILVAVCDSGVEKDHEDLKGKVLSNGWDFMDLDTDANPVTSHGTFVAGLIAASAQNAKGGAGVAPNIKILPLRITNSKGGTTMKIITDCIKYAADKGAKVINVSFTGVQHASVEAAGKYARAKGALLVYSAGNQGRDNGHWPDYENVLAVGATSIDDTRWSWYRNRWRFGGSNYGTFVDLVAPGHNVYSTTTYISHNAGGKKYRTGSGTSYSAPIVSGVAALILSINPKLTPKEVEGILIESADNIGDEYTFGAGRVNANRAVQLAELTIK